MHFRIDIEFTKNLGQFKQKQICRFIHDIFWLHFSLNLDYCFSTCFPKKIAKLRNFETKKIWWLGGGGVNPII
jgi:hypothetical protein